MPKRVSLKGRGADIFFGEYSPSPADPSAADSIHVGRTAATTPAPVVRRRPAKAPPAHDAPASKATVASIGGQSTEQPTDQSTNRPTSRPSNRLTTRVVDRPKAFYITEELDRQLDDAVRYFQMHHGLRKVDRSILLTTMLSEAQLWTDESLDQLVDRLMSQLTSRLRR